MRSLRIAAAHAWMAWAAMVAGCVPQEAAEQVGPASFRDAAGVDTAALDASSGSEAVCALDGVCTGAVPCCPEDLPRCVPSASGNNRCVAAGGAQPGDPCGDLGEDNCVVGAVCIALAGQVSVCRRICAGEADCAGSTCQQVPVPGGQFLGVCANNSR